MKYCLLLLAALSLSACVRSMEEGSAASPSASKFNRRTAEGIHEGEDSVVTGTRQERREMRRENRAAPDEKTDE